MDYYYNVNHETYKDAIEELRTHLVERNCTPMDTNWLDNQLLPIQSIPEDGEMIDFSKKVLFDNKSNAYFRMCDARIYNVNGYFELHINIHG